MTTGIIFLAISLILMFSCIYVEKNTTESWYKTSYQRDERGRITGEKIYHYFNRMKNGKIIYLNYILYPMIISFMIGFVLFFATLITLKESNLI